MASAGVAVVIGAGAVGLAVARALSKRGLTVLVAEALSGPGMVTTGRNSQVIHGGMYYTAGSLKAQCCVQGRRILYDYCDTHNVAYEKRGKLIVSTDSLQDYRLDEILKQSVTNGVTLPDERLVRLTQQEAVELEPELECTAALLSPSTGVLDTAGYCLSLQGDAESEGAVFAFNTPVIKVIVKDGGGFTVVTGNKDGVTDCDCDLVVNCAGLSAAAVANGVQNAPEIHSELIPKMGYAKGNYFALSPGIRSPFKRLIYPLPNDIGLGVHLTVDVDGVPRFGPDVEWVSEDNDYKVDERRGDAFYSEVRKYWPALPDKSLHADYSGIRPKTSPNAGHTLMHQDFEIVDHRQHGVPGLVHLFGIESPGLTSSLALAELVASDDNVLGVAG